MRIRVKDLGYVYDHGTPMAAQALSGIDWEVRPGEFWVVSGPSGSGKTTLSLLLAGLLPPTSGSLQVDGVEISGRGSVAEGVRRRIGVVFQFPEHQLFAGSVMEDVVFGPRSHGLPARESEARAEEALRMVGLDPSAVGPRIPRELSGGQRRLAAVAGILALRPSLLILDEPTVGLDHPARLRLLEILAGLHQEEITIVVVSHRIGDFLSLAGGFLCLEKGRIFASGDSRQVVPVMAVTPGWRDGLPDVVRLMLSLEERGFGVGDGVWTPEEAAERILTALGGSSSP